MRNYSGGTVLEQEDKVKRKQGYNDLAVFLMNGKRVKKTSEIAAYFNVSPREVHLIVHTARVTARKQDYPGIYTAKNGEWYYTMKPKPHEREFSINRAKRYAIGVWANQSPNLKESLPILKNKINEICYDFTNQIQQSVLHITTNAQLEDKTWN